MTKKSMAFTLATATAAALLCGCVVHETSVYQESPQPMYVAQPEVVVLQSEPPPPPVEVIAARPGPNYYWVKGYYAAHGGQWVWVSGNWALPPHAGAVWVEPHYERHGGQVQYSSGYWNNGGPPPRHAVVAAQPVAVPQPQPAVVAVPAGVIVVHRAQPPPRVEVIAARPGPNHFWVKGYWVAQNDNWVWVKGHWELPPHSGAVWVEPRYENHGTEVHFSAGFWR